MQRDTRLDALPLATVVALCAALLLWVSHDDLDAAVAAGRAEPGGPHSVREVASLSAQARPPGTPWGGRSVGELLERVLDPPSLREPATPTPPLPGEGSPSAEPGGEVEQPFVLTGPDGVLLVEGRLRDSAPHGRWVFRHPSGALRARGEFRRGQPKGPWEAWHESGALRARLSYLDGVALGERVEWWPSGEKALEGSYRAGQREGSWRTWHENGQLRSEGSYRAGLRQGPWSEWHANGALASTASFLAGQREGLFRAWYPNGALAEEGHYVRGRREGPWVFIERDGSRDRRSGYYVAGLLRYQ